MNYAVCIVSYYVVLCGHIFLNHFIRFPHVSAWEEYDWGLYWHREESGQATPALPTVSTPPPNLRSGSISGNSPGELSLSLSLSLSLFLSLCVCMFLCLLFPFLVGTPTLPLRGSSKDIKANEKGSRLTLKRKKKEKGKEKEREKGKDKKEKEKEKGKEKEKEKEKPKEQEQEAPKKVEGMWLDDTQKLAAYPDLFMSEVIILIFLIILLFLVTKNSFLIRTWWS